MERSLAAAAQTAAIRPSMAEARAASPAPTALLARVADITPATASDLLAQHGSLGGLRRVDPATLCMQHRLTKRQALRLHAALDLATSLLVEPRPDRPQITHPRDAVRLLLPEMGVLDHEEMRLLLLDAKNRLVVTLTLYSGTVSALQVRVAEVFREAVRRNASALLLAHNHPSGLPDPSPEDVAVTREVVQAGRLLDVEVLDHLIVGASTYVSLRERGLGWN